MAHVDLRDIVTDADRQAAIALSRGPGQDRFVESVEQSYFLWRLLIDRAEQRRGYGTAALDAIVAYVRGRPGGDVLWVTAAPGEGGPRPFYERYGFRPTGAVMAGEVVLRFDLVGRQR